MARETSPQLPEEEVRRLLSNLNISHKEAKAGKELDKLLTRAIKKVESLSEAVAGGTSGQKKLDLSVLPRCIADQAAIQAFNTSYTLSEIVRELGQGTGTPTAASQLQAEEDVFFEYRATLGHLARNYVESGSDFCICQDDAQTSALVIKILGLKMLPNGQHLMEVKYMHNTRENVKTEHLQAIQKEQKDPNMQMKVSVVEGLFLKKVLDVNAGKLEDSYKKQQAGGLHKGLFQVSFLLPADPLSGEQAEELQLKRCAHCHKAPTHSACSRCKLVNYCSKDCQVAHWPGHKQACKAEAARLAAAQNSALEAAAFADESSAAEDGSDPTAAVDIPLGAAAGISGVSSCIPNNRALGRMKVADLPVHEMGQTPANVHGASRFIVKIQSAAGAAHSPHMIYDQSRSFTGFLDPRIGA
ncbi:hypothetical protein WJX84_003554, partial [Apatococcus fuscideae]